MWRGLAESVLLISTRSFVAILVTRRAGAEVLDDLTCEPTSGKPVGRNRGREPWPTWCCRAPVDACRLRSASHDCGPSSRLSVSV